MSYSKVNQGHNTSLIDQDDDLISQDNITAQPYIVPDIEPDTKPAAGINGGGSGTGSTQGNPPVIKPQVPINSSNSHVFQINFYRQFFDLDTDTFIHKIQRALNPFNNAFSEGEENHITELYGFIWITGTLIFLMFVSSTGSNIISSWIHGGNSTEGGETKQYEYKFDLLRLSIALFYGYNLFIPAGLYVITSWILKFPHRLVFTEIISIYGYTNILWVPITFINFIIAILVNNQKHGRIANILEWVIVLLSGAITGASNIMKISPIIEKNSLILQEGNPDVNAKRLQLGLLSVLIVCHLAFTIVVKICFFGLQ
ncbi:protein Yip5p [[Candida] railenensis]|uniref:Protein Yip5p n=1 Tax=[Candida] railenensis TaxID=45579 RepID=A0A9P0VXW1_9ASCO|nr:protein Yip5p [[Candida] railenensis]